MLRVAVLALAVVGVAGEVSASEWSAPFVNDEDHEDLQEAGSPFFTDDEPLDLQERHDVVRNGVELERRLNPILLVFNPVCFAELVANILSRAFAMGVAKTFVKNLLVAVAKKEALKRPKIAALADALAYELEDDEIDVTAMLCEAVTDGLIDALQANTLGVGCATTKSVAFGLGFLLEEFEVGTRICAKISVEAQHFKHFTVEFFSNALEGVSDDVPSMTCQACCPSFKAAIEAEFDVKPCVWWEMSQCSYMPECGRVLEPILADAGLASFVNFCECSCCPAGEALVEVLKELPSSGIAMTLDQNRSSMMALVKSAVSWDKLTSVSESRVDELLCLARDFQQCLGSIVHSQACECGHWGAFETMTQEFQALTGRSFRHGEDSESVTDELENVENSTEDVGDRTNRGIPAVCTPTPSYPAMRPRRPDGRCCGVGKGGVGIDPTDMCLEGARQAQEVDTAHPKTATVAVASLFLHVAQSLA